MSKFLLIIVPQKARLNSAQFQTLVDICVGIGLVTLASIVIPAAIDTKLGVMLLFGTVTSFTFWLIALWLSRRVKK